MLRAKKKLRHLKITANTCLESKPVESPNLYGVQICGQPISPWSPNEEAVRKLDGAI
jgi:hypothetical protein